MTASLRIRSMTAVIFLAAFSLSAIAQPPAPNTTEWENEALKLRLFYPSDMMKEDAGSLMQGGHFTLFRNVLDPQLAQVSQCLRPHLLLRLPQSDPNRNAETQTAPPDGFAKTRWHGPNAATIILAELDVDCLTSEQQNKATNLLDNMAEIVGKDANMKVIAPPSTYTIGWQKVHMAAAQMSPQPSPAFYLMGISTNWNSHLLVWYFSSSDIDTLNRITKTTVRFGRAQAAPLYPLSIGNANR
jgi:hypothetical protein